MCDVRRAAADALADQFGVAARYTDLDALLAERAADLAIVATWGVVPRRASSSSLARSGRVRAILCEKPLAMDAPQAEAMFNVAAECGVLLAEAFRLRNQPIHHRAIELIRSGRIGEVLHVRNAMMWAVPPQDKTRPQLALRQGRRRRRDLRHRLLLHQPAALGDGRTSRRRFRGRSLGATGVDEHVAAIATFAGGRTAEWCVVLASRSRHVAEVLGTAGSVRIENAWGDDPQHRRRRRVEIVDSQRQREIEEFAPTDQFWLQLQHMQDCLENGTPHRIPPADSIAQMRVIDAVYESLKTDLPAPVTKF